jgi:hypothetical protein
MLLRMDPWTFTITMLAGALVVPKLTWPSDMRHAIV